MKKITNKFKMGIEGVVNIYKRTPEGNDLIEGGHNLVVNNGLKNILSLLIGGSWQPTHIGVGTGLTAATLQDLDLEIPVPPALIDVNGNVRYEDQGRNPPSGAVSGGSGDTAGVASSRTIDDVSVLVLNEPDTVEISIQRVVIGAVYNNLNGVTISEAGLFNRYAGQEMFCRRILDNAIGIDKESDFVVEWIIKIKRFELVQDDGTILNQGLEILGELFQIENPLLLNYAHYPKGLNVGGVGTGNVSAIKDMTELTNEIFRSPIANRILNETGTSVPPDPSDLDYTVNMEIQQVIPALTLGEDISEACLYNTRREYDEGGDVDGGRSVSKIFCRAIFDPVDNTDDIVLSWVFELENVTITP